MTRGKVIIKPVYDPNAEEKQAPATEEKETADTDASVEEPAVVHDDADAAEEKEAPASEDADASAKNEAEDVRGDAGSADADATVDEPAPPVPTDDTDAVKAD